MRPAPAMTVTRLLILATLSSLVSCQTPAQAGGGESFISDIPEVRSRGQIVQSNNNFYNTYYIPNSDGDVMS